MPLLACRVDVSMPVEVLLNDDSPFLRMPDAGGKTVVGAELGATDMSRPTEMMKHERQQPRLLSVCRCIEYCSSGAAMSI